MHCYDISTDYIHYSFPESIPGFSWRVTRFMAIRFQ